MRTFTITIAILVVGFAAMTSAAMAAGFGDSTTTSQTTTSTTKNGDTTTTTTTTHTNTESHGFNFGFGSGGRAMIRVLLAHDQGPSYETLGGSWKIGEEHGDKICSLTLDSKKFISDYGAHTGIGCPEGLFGVSSWLLAGDEIRLTSPGGSVLAKLHAAGRNRWNGSTSAGLAIFMTR